MPKKPIISNYLNEDTPIKNGKITIIVKNEKDRTNIVGYIRKLRKDDFKFLCLSTQKISGKIKDNPQEKNKEIIIEILGENPEKFFKEVLLPEIELSPKDKVHKNTERTAWNNFINRGKSIVNPPELIVNPQKIYFDLEKNVFDYSEYRLEEVMKFLQDKIKAKNLNSSVAIKQENGQLKLDVLDKKINQASIKDIIEKKLEVSIVENIRVEVKTANLFQSPEKKQQLSGEKHPREESDSDSEPESQTKYQK